MRLVVKDYKKEDIKEVSFYQEENRVDIRVDGNTVVSLNNSGVISIWSFFHAQEAGFTKVVFSKPGVNSIEL
jgi:hypothetical protein